MAWGLLISGALAASPVTRTPIDAAQLAELTTTIEDALDDAVDTRRAGGMGVALIIDGEVRWLQAAGLADRDAEREFDADTRVPVGELSRLALVAIALRLQERGRLQLDDPLSRHWPDLPVQSRLGAEDLATIRLRDLLTHHAGLSANAIHGMFHESGVDPEPPVQVQLRAPRVWMAESNLGYRLVGESLERIAGMPFEVLWREEVAEPLGLPGGGYTPAAADARLYRKGKPQPDLWARDRAALGLRLGLKELALLTAALQPEAASPWLSPQSRAEMQRVQNADVVLDLGRQIGLGLELYDSVRPGAGKIAVLGSAYPNARAEVRLALDHGVAVVGLSSWRESTGELNDILLSALDGLLQLRAGIPPRDKERALPEQVDLPPGLSADSPADRYATPAGLVDIQAEGERFDVRMVGFDFIADVRADGWYRLRFRLLGVLPLRFDALSRVLIRPVRFGEKRLLVAYAQDRYFLFGSAYAPPQLVDPVWSQLSGTYRLANPDALSRQLEVEEIDLVLDEDLFALRYELPFVLDLSPEMPLESAGPGRLRFAGFAPGLGEELEYRLDADGGVELRFSGYVLRREP